MSLKQKMLFINGDKIGGQIVDSCHLCCQTVRPAAGRASRLPVQAVGGLRVALADPGHLPMRAHKNKSPPRLARAQESLEEDSCVSGTYYPFGCVCAESPFYTFSVLFIIIQLYLQLALHSPLHACTGYKELVLLILAGKCIFYQSSSPCGTFRLISPEP